MTSTDVVVLGAGPAGLMASLRLARAGRRVVVVERAARAGGLAASFDVAGVRVDHGSHRFHPATPQPVMQVVRGLLGDELQRRTRRGRMRLARRWVAFPPSAPDLIRRLPAGLGARLGLDALAAPLRRSPQADTFAEVVRARLGPTLADEFYAPYVRKIWATEPEELSGELARRRVGASSGALVRRVLGRRDPDRNVFWYPRTGFGAIVEHFADAAVAAGVDLRLGTEVRSVATQPDSVIVGTHDGTDGSVEGAQVWSTIPMPALVGLLRPSPPARVLDAAASLEFRSLVLVYLVLATGRFTGFDAHYVPGPDAVFSRLSEPKNYRDGPDPPDRTVLCAEVPCSVGDEVWDADDATLGARVAAGIAALGLPTVEPIEVVTRRVPRAYPVYRVGFEEHFATVDDHLAGIDRILTFGRQGLFAHDNTHHAMTMALAAADALREAGVDRDAWRAARERFRDHVVVD